jgi:hypothetical protein
MKSNAGTSIVEFLLSTVIAAVALIFFIKTFTPLSYQSELTLRTASMYSQYNKFLQALETYVDTSSYNGPNYNVVSCQDLINANLLPSNFPCTDNLGENLEGIIINVSNIAISPTYGSYNYVEEVPNASQNVVNRYFIAVVGVPQTTNQILSNDEINNIAQLNQALYMNAPPLTGGFYIVDSNLNARMVGDLVQSFNLSQYTPITNTILSNPLQNQFINLEGKQYFLIYIDANEIMDTQTPTPTCQITTTTSTWNDSQQVDQQCNAQNYPCAGSNCTYYVSTSACAVQQPPYSSCSVVCNDSPLTIDNYTETQYTLQCTYPNTNQIIKKYLYETNQLTGTTTQYCNWYYLSC